MQEYFLLLLRFIKSNRFALWFNKKDHFLVICENITKLPYYMSIMIQLICLVLKGAPLNFLGLYTLRY